MFGRTHTTTNASKGKYYKPTAVDSRTGRKQSFLAQGGQQHTGASKRSIWHGKSDLDSTIKTDYRFSEGQDANYYDEEEKKLFQESVDIKNLINSLEQLEKTEDETET